MEGVSPLNNYEGPVGYERELRHIVECILAGTPPTVVTAQEGLSAVEICEAAEKSIKLGKVVSI